MNQRNTVRALETKNANLTVELSTMQQEMELLKTDYQEPGIESGICFESATEKNRLLTFNPCGHTACRICAQKLDNQCHVCRKKIKNKILIYYNAK